jgi:two-component system, NtrC family, response regulator AtoC
VTAKIEHQTTTAIWRIEKTAPVLGPRRYFLAFHCRAAVKVVELSDGVSYVVGRAFPSEIVLDDPSLSRQHARFRCHRGAIQVQDLGSKNGVLIRDEKISEAIVSPGDALALGEVTVVVYAVGFENKSERQIATYDNMLDRLEDEIVRSRQFGRTFTVAIVRSSVQTGANITQFWSRVRDSLRAIDTLAPYGASSLLVLLPETVEEDAHDWASHLVFSRGGTPDLECGLAIYPYAGTRVDMLIASAHEACRSVNKRNPIRVVSGDYNFLQTTTIEMVARSDKMREVKRLIAKVAKAKIPILIQGETGTGKEVVARAIHQMSDRKGKRFRAISCATIPNTLIESTLFGHEKGSFTGAHKASPGVFEQASKGTVFLDEIGELSMSAQAALLRVLETKRLVRVGGAVEKDVDVRVIAASHCDLDVMVEQGRFRQDLLYRLNTMVVQLPPLRERVDDIAPLINQFLRQIGNEWGRPNIKVHPDALAALQQYRWPGNVRQLRNIIERAVVVCPGDTINLTDLPNSVASVVNEGPRTGRLYAVSKSKTGKDKRSSLRQMVRENETAIIKEAMDNANGRRVVAAKALRIPLRTLTYKIHTYGIETPRESK